MCGTIGRPVQLHVHLCTAMSMKRTCNSQGMEGSGSKQEVLQLWDIQEMAAWFWQGMSMSWVDWKTVAEGGKKFVEKLKCKVCSSISTVPEGERTLATSGSLKRTLFTPAISATMPATISTPMPCRYWCRVSWLGSFIVRSNHEGIQHNVWRRESETESQVWHSVFCGYLLYMKYPKICTLKVHHGVHMGTSYTDGMEFIHYLAEAWHHDLLRRLAKAKFYFLLLDGSTDTGNIDNEVVLVV